MQRFVMQWATVGLMVVACCGSSVQAYDNNALAMQKSTRQASEGRMRHVGGSMGTGRYEGVGFSSVSAEDAIRRACYWGQKTPVGIGVVRGAGGWYATVLYR